MEWARAPSRAHRTPGGHRQPGHHVRRRPPDGSLQHGRRLHRLGRRLPRDGDMNGEGYAVPLTLVEPRILRSYGCGASHRVGWTRSSSRAASPQVRQKWTPPITSLSRCSLIAIHRSTCSTSAASRRPTTRWPSTRTATATATRRSCRARRRHSQEDQRGLQRPSQVRLIIILVGERGQGGRHRQPQAHVPQTFRRRRLHRLPPWIPSAAADPPLSPPPSPPTTPPPTPPITAPTGRARGAGRLRLHLGRHPSRHSAGDCRLLRALPQPIARAP